MTLPNLISNPIERRIMNLRNQQVLLDKDLAELYGVETKRINEAARRNPERFPEHFRFQLTIGECSRSQIATLNNARGHNIKYLPYAYTEQGVAMLSAVLKSDTAINVSIKIMEAFVAMRRFFMTNASLFNRMDVIEQRQLITEKQVDNILNKLGNNQKLPQQGIFFNNQIFDAYQFVSDLILEAKQSIILIDNYIDYSVFLLLGKRQPNVEALIYTKKITPHLLLDLNKYNSQYPTISLKEMNETHDRFLIIDHRNLYHIGASLKDLGKKWFAFSKIEDSIWIKEIFNRL